MTDDEQPIPEEPEVVDGLPVLSSDEAHTAIEPASRVSALIQPKQVAALAATGFVAGAATVAIVRRHRKALPGRSLRRLASPAKKKPGMLLGEVVKTNSFLVDVHLLRRD